MHSSILNYPYPYKAWLAMANDPDNTVKKDWQELHDFIWEELALPFGDSLFVKSFNQNLPNQVNLFDNPDIGKAHYHDVIHTWGDYMHARKRGFDREDAEEAAQTLIEKGIHPKVWIDHASFIGNFIHGTNKGARASLKDSSGHEYQNFVYSLDIARKLGVCYVWNGEVTPVIGQGRNLRFQDHKQQSGGSALKASAKSVLQQLPSVSLAYVAPDNRQYYPQTFADGSTLYCFRRYGTWIDADIDGLHNLIEPDNIESLLSVGGTSIIYSHLGKRHSKHSGRENHIPDTTRDDLRNISKKYKTQELMVSSVSDMLDYLILRDNVEVENNSVIHFKPDGIRFEILNLEDVNGKVFSFKKKGLNVKNVQVKLNNAVVKPEVRPESDNVFSIVF